MMRQEWQTSDAGTASEIISQLAALPAARSDELAAEVVAAIVRDRIVHAIMQEREECAFAVECHFGLGDPAIVLSCASLIRSKEDNQDDRARDSATVATSSMTAPSAIDALQAIADLPTPLNVKIMAGHEDAYRAVERLFVTPPRIVGNDTSTKAEHRARQQQPHPTTEQSRS